MSTVLLLPPISSYYCPVPLSTSEYLLFHPTLITPAFADKSEGAWGLEGLRLGVVWPFGGGWNVGGCLTHELLVAVVLAIAWGC